YFINFFSKNYAVGPGEIYIFKYAMFILFNLFKINGFFLTALNHFIINHYNLSGINITNIVRAYNVKCRSLRGKDNAVIQLSHAERPYAVRVPYSYQLSIGENTYGISTFNL